MKIAVLFPGQGSQYVGMGKDFIESNEECKNIMTKAEEVSGLPLSEVCLNGPMEELTRAVNLQPAITVTNLICYRALLDALPDSISINCFAGHSLGEYSALYAAGVLTVDDTIKLVAKRGALMDREGTKNPGGMRAVLGLSIDVIEDVVNSYKGNGVVTAANHNTPQQVVLSGSIQGLDDIEPAIVENGGKVIPLNVSVANHSPLVADAVPDFTTFMDGIDFCSPSKPVLFNVSAQAENDINIIKKMMASQMTSRVKWCDIITSMLADGVDTFIEVGPKTVLKGMMRKITPKGTNVKSYQIDNNDTLNKCISSLVELTK